jgi:hypothetical protein
MRKTKQTEIDVRVLFEGKQNSQQAFIELILHKMRSDNQKFDLDSESTNQYNRDKVFSDVRVSRKEKFA